MRADLVALMRRVLPAPATGADRGAVAGTEPPAQPAGALADLVDQLRLVAMHLPAAQGAPATALVAAADAGDPAATAEALARLRALDAAERAVDELPRDYVPPALGGRDRVLAAVRRVLPEWADLSGMEPEEAALLLAKAIRDGARRAREDAARAAFFASCGMIPGASGRVAQGVGKGVPDPAKSCAARGGAGRIAATKPTRSGVLRDR